MYTGRQNMSLYEKVTVQGYSHEPEISTEETTTWRDKTLQLLENPSPPPWVKNHNIWPLQNTRLQLKKFEAQIASIDKILRDNYHVPHHYNFADPIAEILLIILSRKTPESAYLRAHERILKKYNTWQEILDADDKDILDLVYDGGLGDKKVVAIKNMLQCILDKFGEFSTNASSDWDDAFLFEFLSKMPEVGPKSALCIMSYAFHRAAFGVDAHIGRVLARLGTFKMLELDLNLYDHKQKQKFLKDLIPPELRYSLHVGLLAHGRTQCGAQSPKCHDCMLAKQCKFSGSTL
jgi:endonuclease III